MDFGNAAHFLVWLLIVAIVLTVAYLIIAKLIMPAIAPQFQVWIWAIIGVFLLIMVLFWLTGNAGSGFNFGYKGHP
jgi:uncharacterized membrane protein